MHVRREGSPLALGEDAFAVTTTLRGLRRELPLGEAFNERKCPFAERNLALSEGPKFGSVGVAITSHLAM
jgi:hypothetical protein